MLEPELRALLARHNVDMDDVRTLIGIFDHPDSTAGQQAHALAGLSETNLARALLDVETAYLAQRAKLERLRAALEGIQQHCEAWGSDADWAEVRNLARAALSAGAGAPAEGEGGAG